MLLAAAVHCIEPLQRAQVQAQSGELLIICQSGGGFIFMGQANHTLRTNGIHEPSRRMCMMPVLSVLPCHVLAGIRWLASEHTHRISRSLSKMPCFLPVPLSFPGASVRTFARFSASWLGSTTEPTCLFPSRTRNSHNLPPHCRPSDQRRMWGSDLRQIFIYNTGLSFQLALPAR